MSKPDMKVAYFATVNFDEYAAGDLIPGAADWPYVHGYVAQGKIAPVLVALLPSEAQSALAKWEKEKAPVGAEGDDEAQAHRDALAAQAKAEREAKDSAPEPEPEPEEAEEDAPTKTAAKKSTASKK